jgi:hypothetical protein
MNEVEAVARTLGLLEALGRELDKVATFENAYVPESTQANLRHQAAIHLRRTAARAAEEIRGAVKSPRKTKGAISDVTLQSVDGAITGATTSSDLETAVSQLRDFLNHLPSPLSDHDLAVMNFR